MTTAPPLAGSPRRALATGALFALAAGLVWGLVFVTPLLLPEYPAALLSVGRYLAFGLIALPLAAADRRALARLTRADWREALKLSAIGNLLYYLLLASAIQRAGGPLPTMVIGTLPVVIAIVSNRRDAHRDGRLPWGRLLPSLALIATGIALVNRAELATMRAAAGPDGLDLARYATGAVLAVGAVACWTWYPLRNADWLRAHPDRSPRTWATAQGVATLPLALVGYVLTWGVMSAWPTSMPMPMPTPVAAGIDATHPVVALFPMPFGPRPAVFLVTMAAVGLLASWGGTLCWNEASQRLPTTLAGQLIVFETLAALAYAFVLRGRAPAPLTGLGIALLVAGVAWALRSAPEPITAEAHPG